MSPFVTPLRVILKYTGPFVHSVYYSRLLPKIENDTPHVRNSIHIQCRHLIPALNMWASRAK